MSMVNGREGPDIMSRKRAGRFAPVAVLISLLLLTSSLWAQPAKKLAFPYSPIGLNCLPWFVAKDAKIFEKHGIEFDPIFIGASSALFNAMLSGAADLAGSGGPAVISNILKGGDIKGVTILQMGGQPEAFAGLSRGSVDGAVFSPPYNFQLKKMGFTELVSPNDLAKLTEFITNGIVARRSVAEKDKETVIKTIKGTAEAIRLIQTDREFTKKVMNKWMPMKDNEMVELVYRFATENFSKDGTVPEGALRGMVKQMVQSNLVDPKLAAATPVTAYYDNRYVEEVKRSGFFDQLWR